MSLFWNPVTHLYRYILTKCIGKYVKGEIDLQQFEIALSTGSVRLYNLYLDESILNLVLKRLRVPLEVMHGFIEEISIVIPWNAFLSEKCQVSIKGLSIATKAVSIVCDDEALSNVSSVLEDSIQDLYESQKEELAKTAPFHRQIHSFLSENPETDGLEWRQIEELDVDEESSEAEDESDWLASEGLQAIASVIDHMLNKLHVSLTDFAIKIEVPLELHDQRTALHLEVPALVVSEGRSLFAVECVHEPILHRYRKRVQFETAFVLFQTDTLDPLSKVQMFTIGPLQSLIELDACLNANGIVKVCSQSSFAGLVGDMSADQLSFLINLRQFIWSMFDPPISGDVRKKRAESSDLTDVDLSSDGLEEEKTPMELHSPISIETFEDFCCKYQLSNVVNCDSIDVSLHGQGDDYIRIVLRGILLQIYGNINGPQIDLFISRITMFHNDKLMLHSDDSKLHDLVYAFDDNELITHNVMLQKFTILLEHAFVNAISAFCISLDIHPIFPRKRKSHIASDSEILKGLSLARISRMSHLNQVVVSITGIRVTFVADDDLKLSLVLEDTNARSHEDQMGFLHFSIRKVGIALCLFEKEVASCLLKEGLDCSVELSDSVPQISCSVRGCEVKVDQRMLETLSLDATGEFDRQISVVFALLVVIDYVSVVLWHDNHPYRHKITNFQLKLNGSTEGQLSLESTIDEICSDIFKFDLSSSKSHIAIRIQSQDIFKETIDIHFYGLTLKVDSKDLFAILDPSPTKIEKSPIRPRLDFQFSITMHACLLQLIVSLNPSVLFVLDTISITNESASDFKISIDEFNGFIGSSDITSVASFEDWAVSYTRSMPSNVMKERKRRYFSELCNILRFANILTISNTCISASDPSLFEIDVTASIEAHFFYDSLSAILKIVNDISEELQIPLNSEDDLDMHFEKENSVRSLIEEAIRTPLRKTVESVKTLPNESKEPLVTVKTVEIIENWFSPSNSPSKLKDTNISLTFHIRFPVVSISIHEGCAFTVEEPYPASIPESVKNIRRDIETALESDTTAQVDQLKDIVSSQDLEDVEEAFELLYPLKTRGIQNITRQDSCLRIEISKMEGTIYNYSNESKYSQKLSLSVWDLDVLDNLDGSVYNKLLSKLKSAKTTSSPLFCEIHTATRSALSHRFAQDVYIDAKVHPIKVNLDQQAFLFLSQFASQISVQSHPQNQGPSVFIEKFTINKVPLNFDYHPRTVNISRLSSGDFNQLAHIFPLSNVEANLKSLKLRNIEGFDKLIGTVISQWTLDMSTRQQHKYLAGIRPVRTLVKVGSGVSDMVIMPIQQYKKDGNLAEGFRKGSISAISTIAAEAMDIGSFLFGSAQNALENVGAILSGKKEEEKVQVPLGISEGLEQAFTAVTSSFGQISKELVAVPRSQYTESGNKAYMKAVVQGIPSVIISPMIGATKAISSTFAGAKNALDPDTALNEVDKFK